MSYRNPVPTVLSPIVSSIITSPPPAAKDSAVSEIILGAFSVTKAVPVIVMVVSAWLDGSAALMV